MDQLKKLPLKNRIMILNGIIAIAIIGSLYLYWTLLGTITDKRDAISLSLAERDVLNKQIASIEETNAQLENLRDIQASIPNILPEDKEQADIIDQLIVFGDNNNVDVRDISFSGSSGDSTQNFATAQTEALEDVPGVRFTNLTFSFDSDFNTMLNFMTDLEKNQRIMQINSVTISEQADPEDEDKTFLSVVLEVQVYIRERLKTPAPAAGAEAGAATEESAN